MKEPNTRQTMDDFISLKIMYRIHFNEVTRVDEIFYILVS